MELGSPSLSWRALRHWMKVKADTCPSTFLLSFLRLCLSPEIMQQQAAQKWEQHKGLLWHIDPLLYVPLPPGQATRKHPEPCRPGSHSRAVPKAGPPEQAEQENLSSWRGNHQKTLRLAPRTFEQLHHTVPPHSLQHIGPWQTHSKEKPLGRSALQEAERRVGHGSSHQVRRVQHGHPGCHAAVRVLDGLGAQQVTSGLVQHQLLALPAKEREAEPLQSRAPGISLGQQNALPLSAHRAGQSPRANMGALQCWLHWPSANGQCQGLNAAKAPLFPKLWEKDFHLYPIETWPMRVLNKSCSYQG